MAFAAVIAMAAGFVAVLWFADALSEPSIVIDDPLLDPVIVVAIDGAVAKPGLYELPGGSRVQHVLDAAGGTSPDADLAAINPAERVADGQRIAIPVMAPTAAPATSTQVATEGPSPPSASATLQAPAPEAVPTRALDPNVAAEAGQSGTLDLNTATEAELESLPGIGPAKAAAIVAYRAEHGPFAAVADLEDVAGISAAMVAELAPLVHVGA